MKGGITMDVKYVVALKDGTEVECYGMDEVWTNYAGKISNFQMYYFYEGEWVEAGDYAKRTNLDY
jgi:hypothetical protein